MNDDGVAYLHYGDIHTLNRSYIDIRHDTNWLPKLNTEQKINEDSLLYEGDIVFVDASEDYEGIGKSVVIYNQGKIPFVAGLHTIIAKEKSKKLNDNFKRYCFSTRAVRQQFRMLATGATVYGISKTNIKSIIIAVPPLPEQKKIAEILSTVDELIEQTDALIEKAKELKKGLMQQLLTRGIGHTRFKKTELGEIPEEWEVKKLIDVSDRTDHYSFVGGPFGSDLKTCHYTQAGIRVIQLQNIGDGYFIDDYKVYTSQEKADELKKCNIYPGDIIIAKMAEPVARACMVPAGDERYLMCSDGIRLCVDKSIHNCKYILYAINSKYFRENAIAHSTGSTRLRIGLDELRNLPIIIPPPKEQQQIASIITQTYEILRFYQKAKDSLQLLKQGLMQKLLTGQIRVKV